MAASLDGFIARKDGRVDWLETSDEFAGGDTMDPRIRRGVSRDDRLLRHGIWRRSKPTKAAWWSFATRCGLNDEPFGCQVPCMNAQPAF